MCWLKSSFFTFATMSARLEDGIRESQRRATRGLETLHNGINSLTFLGHLQRMARDMKHDPMLGPSEDDALGEAINILQSIVLPYLQERALDNCDDDTQGDYRGHEAQSKDADFPTAKRRRRSHSTPAPPQPSRRAI